MSEAIDRVASLLSAPSETIDPSNPDQDLPVRIDDVSAGLLDARFEVRGDRKGLILAGERSILERPRTLLGKVTPFVGREREMVTLTGLFDECVADPVAQVVLVTAPPGGGKSRLRYELLRALKERGQPTEVWFGRGYPMSAGAPFGVVANLVRSLAHLGDDDPREAQRHKLRARVGRHLRGDDVGRVAAFLGEVAGLAFPDEDAPALPAARRDPALMSDHIQRAWETFVAAECAAQPLLLVLEDLHWGDPASAKLIDGALRRLKNKPLMIFALARPAVHEIFPRLWADRHLQEIRLANLSQRACGRLVRAVLGDEPSATDVAQMVERSGGNPFLLEELIRAHAAGAGAALPDTVVAMVQARLDRLDPEARRVLRAASVFGMRVWGSGVAALLGDARDTGEVERWLDVLDEAEILERGPASWEGDGELVFRQALVREAAYATLTEGDRRLGHRLAGAWLEQRDKADPVMLAEHFARGGEPLRAARHYLDAAEASLRAAAVPQVMTYAAQGIACEPSGEVLGALRSAQMQALALRGEYVEAKRVGAGSLALLRPGSLRACRTASVLGLLALQLGELDTMEAVAGAHSLTAPEPEARDAYIAALGNFAFTLGRFGLHDLAALQLARADEILAAGHLPDGGALGWLELARAYRAWLTRADPWAELVAARSAAASFERVGDLSNAGHAAMQVGHAYIALGAYEEAERVLAVAHAAATAAEMLPVAAGTRLYQGLALAYRGALDEGRAVATEALDAFLSMRIPHMARMAHVTLASIHLLSGDLDAAAREAREVAGAASPSLSEVVSMSLLEAEAQILLARVELARGRPAEARSAADRVMEWMEARGGIGHVESQIHLARAEAFEALEEPQAAREALGAARDRLLERAAQIEDPVLRDSFLAQVPENARTLALATSWGI
ncbi:MAG: AAA family ATPase [Minicystis sp.]